MSYIKVLKSFETKLHPYTLTNIGLFTPKFTHDSNFFFVPLSEIFKICFTPGSSSTTLYVEDVEDDRFVSHGFNAGVALNGYLYIGCRCFNKTQTKIIQKWAQRASLIRLSTGT